MSGKRKGVSLTNVIAVILTVMVVVGAISMISNSSLTDKLEEMFSGLGMFEKSENSDSDETVKGDSSSEGNSSSENNTPPSQVDPGDSGSSGGSTSPGPEYEPMPVIYSTRSVRL